MKGWKKHEQYERKVVYRVCRTRCPKVYTHHFIYSGQEHWMLETVIIPLFQMMNMRAMGVENYAQAHLCLSLNSELLANTSVCLDRCSGHDRAGNLKICIPRCE